MTIVYILIILIALYIVASAFLIFFFSNMVLKPKTRSYDEQMEESLRNHRFTAEYIDSLNLEKIRIKSRFGYELCGIIERNDVSELPENKQKIAILCHGYTSGKITMSGYAKKLMDLGFTCVMYDHRNHGDTGKVAYTTMSYYEKYDLQSVIDYCYERFGNDIKLLTYGESMGSATVLSLYEIDSRPYATVADCGYSDLKELFRHMLKNMFHIPPIFPILPFANIILAKKAHFLIEQVSPRQGVIRSKSPILFCHGLADTFIPCSMSEEMSKLGPGPRELYLCEGAEHALSEVTQPNEYSEVLSAFIHKYY